MKPVRRNARSHARVPVRRLTVQYRRRHLLDFLSDQPVHQKGMLMDLSEGGLRVLVNDPVEEGSTLAINLQLPNVHGGISIQGRVRRCRMVQGKIGLYELGIALPKPGEDYLKSLARLRKDPLLRSGVV